MTWHILGNTYTARTLRGFLGPPRLKFKGRIVNGRWQEYTECQSKSPRGVRYNRLLRLRRRLSTMQAGRPCRSDPR
jgi:hypothetical protein